MTFSTMTFPTANIKALVRRNAIVCRCLTPSPAQALLFGNGPVGGSVHTPDDSLYLLIGRCDNWNGNNRMGAVAAVRVRGDRGLFTGAKTVRQECDLYGAVIRITLQTATGEVRFALTAVRGQDLLVLDIADDRRERAPFTVTLENWHEGDVTGASGDVLESVHVNRTSCFPAMNAAVGVAPEAIPGVTDPFLGRAWGLFVRAANGNRAGTTVLQLPLAGHHRIRMAVVCEPPRPETDGSAVVREKGHALLNATEPVLKRWLARHAGWWRDFWARSYVSLQSATGDAEYEERLWYVTLYTIACGSGGPLPLRFNGGPFLLEKDARSWDNEYVFQNMREIYWPLLAAGHWEFMPEFFRLYLDNVPFARAQAKSLFGADGLCFREGYTMWGCDAAPHNGHVHYYLSSNLECCLLMEWYWRASGDEAFGRGQFYPFLREILEFFMSYAKKGADGRYHLAPVNALETWWKAQDDMADICGLHHFLPRAIAWGRQYGEPAPTLERWQEFLQNLAPIPVGRWTVTREFWQGIHAHEHVVGAVLDPEGIFLAAAAPGPDQTERRNMENPELYIIFPWGMVGMDSPPREVRRAEETWEHRTWHYINNGWAQDAVQLARMGWGERAKEAQLDHARRHQRFPNGSFISAAAPLFHGLLTDTPYFDTAGVHAAALNEMLLQSYDGVIRLAPAVSVEWSGRFKLHALDGFEVEACFAHGQPVAARILATRVAVLKLRNYRRETMLVDGSRTAAGKLLEQAMTAGSSVTVSWEGVTAEAEAKGLRPEVIYPGWKLRPASTASRHGHWHDESTGHGQVGLTEDGLFPATRGESDHHLSGTDAG